MIESPNFLNSCN